MSTTISGAAIIDSTIDSSVIGGTTPAIGNFTEVNVLTGYATVNVGGAVYAGTINTKYFNTGDYGPTLNMATSPYVFYSNCGYSGVPGITSGNYIDFFPILPRLLLRFRH